MPEGNMNPKTEAAKLICAALKNRYPAMKITKIQLVEMIETPPDSKLGDLALPCHAFSSVFDKGRFGMMILGKSQNDVAKMLFDDVKLPKNSVFKEKSVNGIYLNFFFNRGKFVQQTTKQILKDKSKYGSATKKKKKIMVEFCHANTHKDMHVGHFRTTCLGAALANVLDLYGVKAIRANYQGDVGPHVAKCLWAYQKFHKGKTPKGDKAAWLGKLYAEGTKKSEGHEEEIKALTRKIYDQDASIAPLWRKTRKWSLDAFDKIYKQLGVKFDKLYMESQIWKPGQRIAKKVLEKGIAEISEEATVLNLQKYNLGIFLLLRYDGYPLYSTKDFGLAEAQWKDYKPDLVIHVVGSPQKFYFEQLFKTFEIIGSPLAKKSYHLSYEMVRLKGGKMSSRHGTVVLYVDLVKKAKALLLKEVRKRNKKLASKTAEKIAEKLAIGALKYSMLRYANNRVIVFDLKEVLSFEGETGPYLQYALVRAKKIIKKAGKTATTHSEKCSTEQEFTLAKSLASFPDVVVEAAEQYAPHKVANYAYKLSKQFSTFYEACPVLQAESDKLKAARLSLVQAFAVVLKNALSLLGIEEVEMM